MPENGDLIVHATPSKALFIDMLTRDIGLAPCMLDLVDNSVHSLISHRHLDVTENMIEGRKLPKIDARIDIEFTPKRFKITDNCGGITIKEAKDEVFLFGHMNRENEAGLGVYGIGMKRAIFKIGRKITVTSHTQDEEFQVYIDVDKWEKEKEWDLKFEYARKRKRAIGQTIVEIEDLNPYAASQFKLGTFQQTVKRRTAVAYSLFLRSGLDINVNDDAIEDQMPPLTFSPAMKPVRRLLKHEGVEILILAGIAPLEQRRPHGWYIFCNGRLVLDADRSDKTGWGTLRAPYFHSKFNHFLGMVFMRSKDASKLPWTTTKDNVNLESTLYQKVLDEMSLHTRKILDFLNSIYEDPRESTGPERDVVAEAETIDPQELAGHADQTFTTKVNREKSQETVSIQYRRKRKVVEAIKEHLKKPSMSATRVGEYTFDWFYDRNCKK